MFNSTNYLQEQLDSLNRACWMEYIIYQT